MTDEKPHRFFCRKVVKARGVGKIGLLFATKGFEMSPQCPIGMRISLSFDLAPELLNYEGLTDESQPLRDLFLEASSGDGSTSRSALSSACSRNSACNEALRRSVFPCFLAICVSTWVSLARKSSVGAAAERSGTLLLK